MSNNTFGDDSEEEDNNVDTVVVDIIPGKTHRTLYNILQLTIVCNRYNKP